MAILNKAITQLFALTLTFALAAQAHAARLKDIADIEGVRGNQLVGYGLVVGLAGSGDGNSAVFTSKSIANMLEKSGLRIDSTEIKVKNVAAVIVTATLPAFARPGSRIDVTLSSLGDAKSLQGGNLIMTSLKGTDGNVYAVAQGAANVGGFSIEGGGDAAIKNHPTVGVVPGGATIERSIPFDLFQSHKVRITLREPDFTTLTRLVSVVNTYLGRPLAVAVDGGTAEIAFPADVMRNPVAMLASIETLEVERDIGARIVVNEKTGTIIMGDAVTIGRVALAHGNLNITVRSESDVSQPNALSGGVTTTVTNTDIQVGEEKRKLAVVGGGQPTLGELVKALNSLGATPRDLISIFQALKKAGALNAELVVM